MKKKVTLSILIVVLIVSFSFVMLALKGNDYNLKGKDGVYAIEKIRKGEKTGEVLELKSEEINDIFYTRLKNGLEKGGIKVKGINVIMDKNEAIAKIPMNYKGMNFLSTLAGELQLKNGNVEFYPSYLKVGKVKVPLKIALNKLSKIKVENLEINNEKIVVSKNFFPFDIESLYIKENKVYMQLKKLEVSEIFNKIPKISLNGKGGKSPSKTEVGKNSKDGSTNKSNNDESNNSEDSNIKTNNGGKKPNNVSGNDKNVNGNAGNGNDSNGDAGTSMTNEEKATALNKIYGEVSVALGYLQDQCERNVISTMLSTIGVMINNVNYDYTGDAASVQGMYKSLPDTNRQNIKNAIYSYVSSSTIREVRIAFGI